MVKIGIITFHVAHNYGAFLQTFALQYSLKNMGNDVSIIDYCPEYLLTPYYVFKFPRYNPDTSLIKNILGVPLSIVLQILHYPQSSRRVKYFNETISQNLQFSAEKYLTYAELQGTEESYDIYIAGSDQIWNHTLTGNIFDPAFFFAYLPDTVKKYTYAASMGKAEPPKEFVEIFSEYTKRFSAISMRECESVPFVKTYSGKEVYCVLDPTLLLTESQWSDFAKEPLNIPGKYLLSYYFGSNPEYFKKVKSIAKSMNLDIVWISNKGVFCKYFTLSRAVHPKEFVWYFAHASAVITGSFHGTMFSIINKKPFYSIAPYPQSVRIEDHLRRFGLLDRLYVSPSEVPDTVESLDYTAASEKIEEWRRKSFAYLDMITKPDDEQ